MLSKMRLVHGKGQGQGGHARHRGLGVLGALGLLLPAACTHTPHSGGVFVTARPQIVAADERGLTVAVPAGQPLRTGQVFALNLVLEQPAHVYVVHRRGGLVGSLYPGVGQADVELPAGPVRVPDGDTFMLVPALDRQTHLCVLLSAEVLPAALRRCPDAHNRHPGKPVIQSFALPTRSQ